MGFKNFRFQVIIRGIGIGLTAVGLAWSIYLTEFYMTPLVFGILTLLQLIGLIYYVESTLKEVKRIADSFEESDYTRKFDESEKGRLFQELGRSFNRIVEDFKRIRIEKEEHYRYLVQVNQHVSVGLICFKADGRIDLMNKAAAALLNTGLLDRMEYLKNRQPEFHDLLIGLKPGEKELFHSDMTGETRDLALVANKFKLNEETYTLVSLQDIRSELDANEMTAWQKLIRVLTHEIMNSVTPVVSLTTAMKMMMEDSEGNPIPLVELDPETGEDIYRSVFAISNRGKGLLGFVNAYRDYTNPPEPEMETVNLLSLASDTLQVLKSELGSVKAVIDPKSSEAALVQADGNLIGQVLVNLVKNAYEALQGTDSPEITLLVKNVDGGSIRVKDNGPGIPPQLMDEIFVPFFTTKEKGNGIGLSLSKQIMKSHGGDLLLKTSENGTSFTLQF